MNRIIVDIEAYMSGRSKPVVIHYDIESLTREELEYLVRYLTEPLRPATDEPPTNTGTYPVVSVPAV